MTNHDIDIENELRDRLTALTPLVNLDPTVATTIPTLARLRQHRRRLSAVAATVGTVTAAAAVLALILSGHVANPATLTPTHGREAYTTITARIVLPGVTLIPPPAGERPELSLRRAWRLSVEHDSSSKHPDTSLPKDQRYYLGVLHETSPDSGTLVYAARVNGPRQCASRMNGQLYTCAEWTFIDANTGDFRGSYHFPYRQDPTEN